MNAVGGAELVDRELVDDLLAQQRAVLGIERCDRLAQCTREVRAVLALELLEHRIVVAGAERVLELLVGRRLSRGFLEVTDQLARRGDPDPAAQRTLALVAGDARGPVVTGDQQLDAQQLLDLVDQILGCARRRPRGVDLGEDLVERGVRGRFLGGACGGEGDVGDRNRREG
jgi:hypothetical protein